MSFFEWLGESFNPGTMGSVELHIPEKSKRHSRGEIIFCFICAVLLLGILLAFTFSKVGANPRSVLIVAFVIAVYLATAYFVRPTPDYSNVGWLGGFIDHPFRISDDVNRLLLFLLVALLPGRFIVESCLNFIVLLLNVGK